MSSRKSKGNRGKVAKFPDGAADVPVAQDVEPMKSKAGIDEKVVEFCDKLINSDWEPMNSRPKHDLFGIYMVCRWYAKDNMWVILYVGRGHVKHSLDSHLNGKRRSAIGQYLTSFAKADRKLVWMKWLKDPFHPYESIPLEHVLTVIKERYNRGEKPAFNMDQSELGGRQELPDDFSIVPDWHKAPRGKKSKAVETA